MARSKPSRPRGLVVVYTGDGKGKTTAALGMALRAVGHGLRVLVIEFLKGKLPSGERAAAKRLAPELTIVAAGGGFVSAHADEWPGSVRAAVREGWRLASEAALSGEYDLVVLDELNCVVDYGAITVDEVLALIARRPPHVHVVLTGRRAHRRLLRAADLVTHVRSTKHPFTRGVRAQEGIEY
jgi:cob(I)alamin adenosyltransferase